MWNFETVCGPNEDGAIFSGILVLEGNMEGDGLQRPGWDVGRGEKGLKGMTVLTEKFNEEANQPFRARAG